MVMNCECCGKEINESYICDLCGNRFCNRCINHSVHKCAVKKQLINVVILIAACVVAGFFFITSLLENQTDQFDNGIKGIKSEVLLNNEALDGKLALLDQKVKKQGEKIDGLKTNLVLQQNNLLSSITKVNETVLGFDDKIEKVGLGLETYKSNIDNQFDSFSSEISSFNSDFVGIDNRVDNLNFELDSTKDSVEDITDEVTDQLDDFDFTYRELINSTINGRIVDIDQSIDDKFDLLTLTNPKTVTMPYVLRGVHDVIEFEVYKGFRDYLNNVIPMTFEGGYDISGYINNTKQRELLLPLVDKIKSKTTNKDDQARIVINMVQQIFYDYDYRVVLDIVNVQMDRYPYELIYDQRGICGEVSHLTTFLLKELGYGVVLFDFPVHVAAGIKCPIEYSYGNTGYCFIESTGPSIITDSYGYTVADIIYEFNGNSFDSVSEEYNDLTELTNLLNLTNWGEEEKVSYYGIIDKYGMEEDTINNVLMCEDIGKTYCDDECWSACPEGFSFICLPNQGRVCRNADGDLLW